MIKNRFMNNKGFDTGKPVFYIAFSMFLGVVLVVISLLVSEDQVVDVPGSISYTLLSEKLLNSGCLLHEDSFGDINGIVDIEKFTSKNLDRCLSGIEGKAYKLTLSNYKDAADAYSGFPKTISTSGWDHIAKRFGAKVYSEKHIVTVLADGAAYPSVLEVEHIED